jgi:S1-C subfamily serine protease
MAANAADYLNNNPGSRMVILAGSGHVAFGSGIPSRLGRRTHTSYAIVLNSGENIEPKIADYILLSNKEQLPPAGTLGANLQEGGGECRIRSLDPAGAAEKAGLKRGDALVEVDGQPVKTVGDVRLALWDKKPGQRILVRIRRGGRLGANAEHKFEIELAARSKDAIEP